MGEADSYWLERTKADIERSHARIVRPDTFREIVETVIRHHRRDFDDPERAQAELIAAYTEPMPLGEVIRLVKSRVRAPTDG